MSSWLIVGATGGIASATARELARLGHKLYLADRPETKERLASDAEDLRVRYRAEVETFSFEATDFKKHATLLKAVDKAAEGLDGVLWTAGVMWPQEQLQANAEMAAKHHEINYTSMMSFLGLVADLFEERKAGQIVAIGSPAGDRGRQSNYLYGADKAAVHAFMQGLRQRLAKAGVHVMTVKPGPTRTPMTAGMDDLPLPSEPQTIAVGIVRGIIRRSEVVYVPGIWRLIMWAIIHTPEFIFKRLSM